MSPCRFAWYERGRVRRHVAGQQRPSAQESGPTFPARLKAGPDDIIIVEAEMSGALWFGTLTPKSPKTPNEGLVILFERPAAKPCEGRNNER